MSDAARCHECRFGVVVVAPGHGRDKPLVADADARRLGLARQRCQRLAVAGDERVEVHEVTDAIGDVLQRPRHHHTAVGIPEQHDAVEILVEDLVDDIVDVRAERDLRARQVRALTDAGEAGCEDLVPGRLQAAPHVPEAVRAGPGPVDEYERRHLAVLRRLRRAACPTREGRVR